MGVIMSPPKAEKIYDYFYGYFIAIILSLEVTLAKKHVIEMPSDNAIMSSPNQTLVQRTGLELFESDAEATERIRSSTSIILEGIKTTIEVTKTSNKGMGTTDDLLPLSEEDIVHTEHPNRLIENG